MPDSVLNALLVYARSSIAPVNAVDLIAWVLILDPLFTSCVTLSRCLSHLILDFLICSMGVITVPYSLGCYNELVIKAKCLNNV